MYVVYSSVGHTCLKTFENAREGDMICLKLFIVIRWGDTGLLLRTSVHNPAEASFMGLSSFTFDHRDDDVLALWIYDCMCGKWNARVSNTTDMHEIT